MTGDTRSLRGKGLGFTVAAVIVALDLWSKQAVFASLGDDQNLWLAGEWFGFTKVMNPGTMWGKLKSFSDVLPWVRVVAAVVVVSMITTTPARARLLLAALGLVLGGAVGNIYDGFAHGAVRDFLMVDLDVRFFDPFPIFNVADSAICVGVGLLALTMWGGAEEEAGDSGREEAEGLRDG